MSEHILPGDPPVILTLRRSSRARRISLRVSGLDGRVTLTLPRGTPDRQALQFAQTKAAWLRAQLDRQSPQVPVSYGTHLPLEGQSVVVVPTKERRIAWDRGNLGVPGPEDTLPARLEAWLKARARDRLAEASDRFSASLGKAYSRISLRDTRSRWGSCTAEGRLMYSWRLVLAPQEVLNYVAAHEVAHLAEMNHSAAFWSLVARLYPDYDTPRRWLRENGADLHRYRFRT
ncbi:MAG: SprT family zinc-dependent metalloprotease [Pseudomonadota bacterium]